MGTQDVVKFPALVSLLKIWSIASDEEEEESEQEINSLFNE